MSILFRGGVRRRQVKRAVSTRSSRTRLHADEYFWGKPKAGRAADCKTFLRLEAW